MMLHYLEHYVDSIYALLPRKEPDSEQIRNTRLIAHRGAHDKQLCIKENTDKAFARAYELGCWGIEFDVRTCADDVLVVHHDETLQRVWKKKQTIAACRFQDIRALAPNVPTLAEIVSKYGQKIHLFIELKAPFTAFVSLVNALKHLTPCQDYYILSLNKDLLPQLSRFFPKESLLLVPVVHNVYEFLRLSLGESYGGILSHYLLMNRSIMKRMAKAEQMTGVGFIDSKYSLYREVHRGMQYLFTNNASEVCQWVNELKENTHDKHGVSV